MTSNFDRIKAMSIEELAKTLGKLHGSDIWCEKCTELYFSCYNEQTQKSNCEEFAKQWLQAESEEEC